MDEALRVLERLDRIEALDRVDGPPGALLAELRGLLREGEEWLRAEHEQGGDAAAALDRCRAALVEATMEVAIMR